MSENYKTIFDLFINIFVMVFEGLEQMRQLTRFAIFASSPTISVTLSLPR